MGNDIQISVRVSNDTGTGLASVNRSMRDLRNSGRDAAQSLDRLARSATTASAALRLLQSRAEAASRSLRDLQGNSTAAAAALRDLRDGTNGTNNSLRTLNVRAQTADGRLNTLADRTRTLRSDSDDLDGSMRRLTTTMGGLRGNVGTLRTSTSGAGSDMQRLQRAALLLSPALIPIAAAAVPIAAGLGAATVAVGAFGLAIGGQIAAMSKASDAEKKYKDAVKEHGKTSEQAGKAEAAYLQQVRAMDPATRRAAASLSVFKDQYKEWSKSLAGDTMPVVTKGLAVFGGLLPRLTPLVKGTSAELDRLMTVLAGGVASPGFERFMDSFAEFASGALSKATDGLVRFMRAMSGGAGSSQFTEFMAYVREVGPAVGQTLGNLGRALAHLVAAASETGVGLLSAINAFAKLVNAIPTEALSALLQFVVVFKAVKLAAAGLGGAGGAMTAFSTQLVAMQAASVAAGGGLAGLAAAFGTLSRAAKVAVAGTAIGLIVVAAMELSEIGKEAPVNIGKLTSSLKELGQSGKASGELTRVFGKDLKDLDESLREVVKPSNLQSLRRFRDDMKFWGDTHTGDLDKKFENIDKSLADMVASGNADLAAAALKEMGKSLDGMSLSDLLSQLPEYKDALGVVAFEQKLAADSMGIFGDQALATSAKLAAQKQSADGLRQAIIALNEVNRSAHDAQTQFGEALDGLTASFKEHGATLSADTEAGRANRDAMSAASAAQDELIASGLAAGDSLGSMTKKSETLRAEMMRLATDAFDNNKQKATAYVNTLLGAPGEIKTMVKLEREEAINGLEAVRAAIQATPGAKSVKVDTLNAAAIAALEAVGLKTRTLKDGRTEVFTANGQSLGAIGAVSTAMNNLDGKTAKTFTTHTIRTINEIITKSKTYRSVHDIVGATGGLFTGTSFKRGYADGGLVQGPGTETSDDVFAPWLSKNEFVVNARSTAKHLRLLKAINDDRLQEVGLAKGGRVSQGERDARRDARGALTISHFGRMAGFATPEFRGNLARPDSMGALVNALNQWRSVINKATHGGTEKSLLRQLDSAGKALIKHEKNLLGVNKQLEGARARLADLKSAASQLSSSVREGVLSSSSITRGAGGDKTVTTAGIMSGLVESRDKATAFAGALKDLKSRGVSKDLIGQIAEAGIGGGGLETAGALLGASSSEIASINELQKQIGKAAGDAGKAASDAMYGAGIAAAEGLVKGLTRKQKDIEAAMMRIAKSMERAIKRALGIRSPSKVMQEVGHFTAEGFAVGMEGNRRTDQAWTSMLNVPRSAGPAAAAGRREPVVIELRSSGSDVDEFLLKMLRRAIKARGNDVQFVLTGRKTGS